MIVVEYSKSQNAFHRHTMEERIESERLVRDAGQKSDYELVAEFDSHEDADKFIKENYESVKEFGYFKNQKGELVII